ncbi:ABC transporter substrate-binding protein [Actinomadura craniellae]|uniref:ABC transporter substrate-binding protein n=1 Tax=Actinomadura craniellae TaxID=2231787 RepID=A0A365H0V5_9ACTN|nr:ABC transporter substrate-binding protein [Actinomadura craniellae]RAY12668.1 ABC transporter substrate-binding protein [Actinomadura craniellae]
MKPKTSVVALVALALLAAGCGRSGSGAEEEPTGGAGQVVSGDFGDLKDVCGPGKVTSSPAQGVTASQIELGVFSDVGFTKNPEYLDTAKVFTSWCNAAGGINGRKLVANIRDAKFMEVRQRMIESCREDFALVGGSAGLDGLGVKDRLSCLLPALPAQVVQLENNGSDLQLSQIGGASYNRYTGYFSWLVKEAHPSSAGAVGIAVGDSPATKVLGAQTKETFEAIGGKVVYEGLFPAQGVTNWAPYAQAVKSKGVKGLVFFGSFADLAKLAQALTNINYKLDWIDANSNSYGPAFVKLAGTSLDFQNALADLSGVYPLENASANPATKQVLDLFARYAPKGQVTLQAVRAFSSWLLFAKSAKACGDALTRKCLYETARKEAAWTGGGLMAPVDFTKQDAPLSCFNVEKASSQGWKPADFKPNQGAYRCGAPAHKFTGTYIKPVTLADVGKSMNDLK